MFALPSDETALCEAKTRIIPLFFHIIINIFFKIILFLFF